MKTQRDVMELPNLLKLLPFAQPSGKGYDLPNGCIVQMNDKSFRMNYNTGKIEVAPNCNSTTCLPPMCLCLDSAGLKLPHFMYWNPNGVAISNDESIRTLCYNPHKAPDGTEFLPNIKIINNHFHISMTGCNLLMIILIYLKKD